MKITQVEITRSPSSARKGALAVCTVTFDDVFVVHGIWLMEGEKGRYLSMPSRKGKNGKIFDIAHPVTATFREHLFNRVLSEFNDEKQVCFTAI